MIEFNDDELSAQKIAQHYAKKLSNRYAFDVMSLSCDISSPDDAENITRFYWSMVDLAVEDQDSEQEIEGEADLEFWMEKLLNILMGYLNRLGFGEIWAKISDEMNGR